MRFAVTCTLFLEIEADNEREAYEEARERIYRQYRFSPDSIEIEPDDEE